MKGPAIVLALILLLGTAAVAQAEYLIKFSHTDAADTAKGRAADSFADQVNERLAGKVRVEVFPGAALYDDEEVLEAVRQSNGDTGIMAAPRIDRFVKLAGGLGIFDLPFLFDRVEDVHRLVDSPLGKTLLQPLAAEGIKGLAIWDEGMKVFSVRGPRPLRKPLEDFQGKKLGTWGSEIDKAMIAEVREFLARPALPPPELPEMLKQPETERPAQPLAAQEPEEMAATSRQGDAPPASPPSAEAESAEESEPAEDLEPLPKPAGPMKG